MSNVQLKDLSLTGHNEPQLAVQIDAAVRRARARALASRAARAILRDRFVSDLAPSASRAPPRRSQINPGNSGGPVFNQATGDVVGVAFAGLQDAEGTGFIIPTPVVRNFLAVFEATGGFGRLPKLGVRGQVLDNAAMRALVLGGGDGAPPAHHDGMLLTRVARGSCARAAGVRAGDVLMAIDGAAVSEDGEVSFRGHERLPFESLITAKKNGEKVTLSLLRHAPPEPAAAGGGGGGDDDDDKAERVTTADLVARVAAAGGAAQPPARVEVVVTLAPARELVPRELGKDYHPEWIVAGGLVLLIAGLPLAQQLMSGRPGHADYNVAMRIYRMLDDADAKGRAKLDANGEGAQAVIVGACLAHDLNVGYKHFVGRRVRAVNGASVRNARHAAELLAPFVAGVEAGAPPPAPYVAIEFASTDATAVFEARALREMTPGILKQHKIPTWTSLEL